MGHEDLSDEFGLEMGTSVLNPVDRENRWLARQQIQNLGCTLEIIPLDEVLGTSKHLQ